MPRVLITVLVLVAGLSFVAGSVGPVAGPPVPDEAGSEAAAVAAARLGGKSVLVSSRTDETTEVRANPDGTFTMTQHVRPVRVRRGEGWVPVDTTLARRADGSIGPHATVVGLELSAGGPGSASRPLVTAAADGAEVGLRWPTDLPEPKLSGATATYSEVLPGVDLRVTADVLGFSQVLIVKNRDAARNPALRRITFGSVAGGLTVSAEGDALRATDTAGKVVFTGDASRMWDSARENPRGATMGVEVGAGTLTIVPDQNFLSATDTAYPVYLDPSYFCTSCGKLAHTVVQSAFPTARNFNRTDGKLGDLKAGYWCVTGDCPEISRSFLRMNTAALAGRYIHSAAMHVRVINSARCTDAQPTTLAMVHWMDANTTWNIQPGVIQWLGSGNRTNNADHCPTDGGMDLDALAGVRTIAANSWPEVTFALFGSREGDSLAWRRFDLNPWLVVTYNSWPNAPWGLGMEGWGPNAHDAIGCVLGSQRPFIATRTPRLRGVVSDPDGGIMDAEFRVLKGPKDSHPWDERHRMYVNPVPSGSFAEARIPGGMITEDGVYNWVMWNGDGELLTWSQFCEFHVDTVKPDKPVVRSDRYPADRSAGGVGQGTTFTFDPGPATNDTAYYLYAFTSTGGIPQTRLTPAALNGPVTLPWTPTLSGPQTLSVRAIDRAGNASDITHYRIVVSDFQVGIGGKVAQWSFENTLADTAGAKSLTYEGPPPGASFRPGHQGQGVLLDPDNAEFFRARDALVRTDTSFTVSAWAKPTRTDDDYFVASQDGDRMSGFHLHYHRQHHKWIMSMPGKDDEHQTPWFAARSTDPPVLGQWTHLAGVYDATARKLRLYVNGTKVEADAPPQPWNAKGQFIVGANKAAGQRADYFAGEIDSVRVHDRALSDAEVAALRAGTATGNPTAEYLFENNLTSTATGANLTSPTQRSYMDGYAGRGLGGTAANGQWATTSRPLINTSGAYSVAGWVRLANKNAFQFIAGQDGNRMPGFHLRYTSGVDKWTVGVPTSDTDNAEFQWLTADKVPRAGVWTHLAVVHEIGVDRHRLLLYVDGVLDGAMNLTATIDARGPFTLGVAQWTGGRTGAFDGDLDEINVYDGALTPVEVAALANLPVERARYALNETSGPAARDSVGGAQASIYGTGITWGQHYGTASANFSGNSTEHAGTIPGPGPVARWDFNNQLTDSSGNGRTLVHQNNSGPTPAGFGAGRINEGVALNGTDQRLVTSGPVVDTTRSYSVSAWAKLDRKGNFATVASQDGGLASPFYLQYSRADDRWAFSLTAGNVINPDVVRVHSRMPPDLGVWTHLLGVYDSVAGRARLFVNGQLEGDLPVTAAWPSTGPFAVGRALWNGTLVDFFPGTIDEVRVYDRVLSAADAHGLWNLGSNFRTPRPAAFRTDQSFVLSAWVRHNGFDAQSRQVIAADGNRIAPVVVGYRAEWRRWAVLTLRGPETGGETRWVLSDNEAGTYADANGWVHLTVAYDAPAHTVRLYVNGNRQSTVPSGPSTVIRSESAGTDVTLPDTGRELVIGRTTWKGQSVDSWNGAIRDVRIFSGVLPEACDNTPTCLSQLPWQ